MNKNQSAVSGRPRISSFWKIILAVFAVIIVAAVIAARYAIHHAEPILRARVIQTLSARFNSQVQLGEFHVTVDKGLGVEGKDLSLHSNLYPDLPPQISLAKFEFHAGLLDIFRRPMHVHLIELHGLVVRIPPRDKRAAMPKTKRGRSKIKIVLDRIVCDDTLLMILKDDPSKTPMQFKIHALTLRRVGSDKPMQFDAQLINPKPIGDIASHGSFGPWNADAPHSTPVDGEYSFTNADLSTTKGITGTLSSKGKFTGPLDTITVDGETDTPNFSVDVSGHQVALHTVFHAIVDGTNGNTDLQPVHAHFLNTDITATGTVNRAAAGIKGHDINLDILIDKGRVEDLLQIGAKTLPPVMSGAIHLKTKFHLPPGKESVSRKLQLRGAFSIENALFSNPHIQKKVDELSMRAQGHSDEARELAQEQPSDTVQLPHAAASMHGNFSLVNRKLALPQLVCTVPGAHIALTGTYTLDGKQFDFTGRAQMQAHVSSLVGGWKGSLLTPLNPFFAHGGAGTDVPIKITGTKSKPHFGLNF